jgi:hypothetical protein
MIDYGLAAAAQECVKAYRSFRRPDEMSLTDARRSIDNAHVTRWVLARIRSRSRRIVMPNKLQ